jgi:DNA-binding NtrC family response regulator
VNQVRILIVDDEAGTRSALAEMLEGWGHRVEQASDGHEALRRAIDFRPDIVISDLVMPQTDGLWLLKTLKEELPDCPVVMVTGRGSVDVAVLAIKEGAYDFIEKPLDPAKLKVIIARALEKKQTLHEVQVLKRRLGEMTQGQKKDFVGISPSMRKVTDLIAKVAPSKAPVVITGESGTGKEVVARSIHNNSPRRDKAFIAINCSAIPATLIESELFGHEKGAFTGADARRLGCFELADGGTLFLDEIGELPLELQSKFLRVLEEERLRRLGGKGEIEVDVRVVCATNRDLKEEIKAQRFREDLYFRLNVFHVLLPPLRDRREDVPLLVQHFVDKFNAEGGKKVTGVDPAAMTQLQGYAWPGNIRELRNTVERAVILCDGDVIDREHLPTDMVGAREETQMLRMPLGLPLKEIEKEYILSSLQKMNHNKSRTAQILGISEKTLYNKLNRYNAQKEGKALPPDDDDADPGPEVRTA